MKMAFSCVPESFWNIKQHFHLHLCMKIKLGTFLRIIMWLEAIRFDICPVSVVTSSFWSSNTPCVFSLRKWTREIQMVAMNSPVGQVKAASHRLRFVHDLEMLARSWAKASTITVYKLIHRHHSSPEHLLKSLHCRRQDVLECSTHCIAGHAFLKTSTDIFW